MTATRWIPAVTVLCALGALSACSGDDGGKSTSPASSRSASSGSGDAVKEKQRTCKVQVEVTGTAQVSWTGKGASRTGSSGPKAVYTASKGGAQISVYSSGTDFATNANVTIDGATFTTPPGDDTGLDVSGSGKSAKVDADARGVKPSDAVHITASFDC